MGIKPEGVRSEGKVSADKALSRFGSAAAAGAIDRPVLTVPGSKARIAGGRGACAAPLLLMKERRQP